MGTAALLGGDPVTDLTSRGPTLAAGTERSRELLIEAFDSGLWDDWPDTGSQADRFAKEFARFNRAAHCALVTNGTHTLQLALEALEIGFGDEVIVPGLTWQATASVVCDVNAVPVMVDVDPETMTIDPALVAEAVTDRTRAVIPVHLYHRMADMDAIMSVCNKRGLHCVEDAAHAHGSIWRDQHAGSIGDLGSFSFQRSKLMNCAEGGALITSDDNLFDKVMSLRNCGRTSPSGVKVHSGNYRLTALQAAVLRGELDALQKNANELDRRGRALDQEIGKAPGVAPLHRSPHLTRQCSYGYAFLYDEDAYDGLSASVFRKALSAELGVGFGTCYEPLNQSPYYFPHEKRRHHLSDEYVAAITPSRFELPVAEALWKSRIVQAHWPVFQLAPGDAPVLGDAISKIFENRHELRVAA